MASGRQGFINNNEVYVYQEGDSTVSAAFGIDSVDSNWKLKILPSSPPWAAPSGICQIAIDPAAAGNIVFTPNGAGKVVCAYMGFGAVTSSATGELTSSAGSAGQVLTSNGAGAAPTFQANAAELVWARETTTPITMAATHGYIQANAGAGLTTFVMPATAAIGTVIEIIGESSGGWTITHAVGTTQYIQYGSLATTVTTGSLSSSNRYDCVRLICRVADTVWTVVSAIGVLNVL